MLPGRGRGIAIDAAYGGVVAQLAEVTVAADGQHTVDRVFCAVDVGILFGVITALMSAVTLEAGMAMESNFHDLPTQRLADVPGVLVEILRSGLPPECAGEPGIIPVVAAIANAIHDATGPRLRSLPLEVTETVGERRTRSTLAGQTA